MWTAASGPLSTLAIVHGKCVVLLTRLCSRSGAFETQLGTHTFDTTSAYFTCPSSKCPSLAGASIRERARHTVIAGILRLTCGTLGSSSMLSPTTVVGTTWQVECPLHCLTQCSLTTSVTGEIQFVRAVLLLMSPCCCCCRHEYVRAQLVRLHGRDSLGRPQAL